MSADADWEWLAEHSRETGAEQGTAANRDLSRAFARCFATADGQQVLAHLRRLTLDRALGPAASDAQLRHLEGQRQLVTQIQALITHGMNDA